MATKKKTSAPDTQATATVAALLAGVIYQAKLQNRQSKLNIPESEVIADVIGLWHTVVDALNRGV